MLSRADTRGDTGTGSADAEAALSTSADVACFLSLQSLGQEYIPVRLRALTVFVREPHTLESWEQLAGEVATYCTI